MVRIEKWIMNRMDKTLLTKNSHFVFTFKQFFL